MVDVGYLGAALFLALTVSLNGLVVAYRWGPGASIHRAIDRIRQRLTGRPDWSWLRLWHLLLPLVLVSAANVGWQVATLHCNDDSLALLVSGRAALHGQNPFVVSFCSEPTPDLIPYGLAAVSLNALAALSGTVAGVWIVWQALALAVVPLVWAIGGEDRRYLAVLAGTSVLYLPNVATNIGVDNAIVPVSVLLLIYAMGQAARRRGLWTGIAAFLSTARFPALFPLLGASGSAGRARERQFAGVLGVFLVAAGLSFWFWGWDSIGVVYLDEFGRQSGFTLNLFAVLVYQGWLVPSLASAVVQGGVLVGLVLFVNLRRYPVRAACAVPLVGVMSLSQYLDFHFVLWMVPLVLLGTRVNGLLLLYGAIAAVDTLVAIGYLGLDLGVWWPYEALGVVLSAVLLWLLVEVVRDEEARRREERSSRISFPSTNPSRA
jgi:hypothetical protein